MANEYAVNKADLTVVADAIRTRGETSDSLVFPDEYVTAIEAIKGGAELNFSVVACASESDLPATAKENTIAVITNTQISGYSFSNEEPENPIGGHVWIATGAGSAKSFNALSENTVMVYPLDAKQYTGGAWVEKNMLIFHLGEWARFVLVLYEAGNNAANFYTYDPPSTYAGQIPTSFASDGISIAASTNGTRGARIITSESIDVGSYDKLYCLVNVTKGATGEVYTKFGLTSGKNGTYTAHAGCAYQLSTGEHLYEVDVSELDAGFVGYEADSYSTAFSLVITKIWLE